MQELGQKALHMDLARLFAAKASRRPTLTGFFTTQRIAFAIICSVQNDTLGVIEKEGKGHARRAPTNSSLESQRNVIIQIFEIPLIQVISSPHRPPYIRHSRLCRRGRSEMRHPAEAVLLLLAVGLQRHPDTSSTRLR